MRLESLDDPGLLGYFRHTWSAYIRHSSLEVTCSEIPYGRARPFDILNFLSINDSHV